MEKQQQPSRCDHQKMCGKSKIGKHTDGKLYCYDEDCDDRIVTFLADASMVMLPEKLRLYYTDRSRDTGKPISQLVLQDLAALHRKRVAREEKRVWKENEMERL